MSKIFLFTSKVDGKEYTTSDLDTAVMQSKDGNIRPLNRKSRLMLNKFIKQLNYEIKKRGIKNANT